VRETFARMAMNDEETAALTCRWPYRRQGHGNGDAKLLAPEPEGGRNRGSGLWLAEPERQGQGRDTLTSGRRRCLDDRPNQVGHGGYFELLLAMSGKDKEPAGAWQWKPVDIKEEDMPVDVEDPSIRTHADDDRCRHGDEGRPDLSRALEKFMADPDYFSDTFARAWFKLTHRDMGPKARYVGPDVPKKT
jgi:catalase-peroxidase